MVATIKSDTALRVEAMKVLVEYLGAVNTERFINSIQTDHFDYTTWQRDLWQGKTIEEIHHAAAARYAAKHDGGVALGLPL
jgi:hypothetical protein